MNVAFCCIKNIYYGGGIERYTLELGQRLAQRGHTVTVYSMRHYGEVPSIVQGMHIVGTLSTRWKNSEKLTACASAAVRTLVDPKVDIVHFHALSSGWAACISKLRRQKCVLQSHGVALRYSKWGTLGSQLIRALERMAVLHCDAITCVSNTQVQYYLRRYGKRAVYIPCGVSLSDKVEPSEILTLGLSPAAYLLSVGRISREKGFHYLISAFRRLRTDLKLVLAGGVSDTKYMEQLREVACGDRRIEFLGMVQGRLLAELLSNAAIYVQPSELEGMSLALLEAMGYGNCCLVSNIPENLEVIGPAGFTFESRNANSLYERLNWLVEHPSVACAVGLQARECVKSRFSWECVTDQMENLYLSLVNGQGSQRTSGGLNV